MAKTKLRWIFPPAQDLQTIEVKDIKQQSAVSGQQSAVTQLRPCQYGMNEMGEVVKKLYCTPEQQPRFFVPYPDGWHEQQPCYNHKRRKDAGLLVGHKSKGGGYDCSFLRQFGNLPCHRAVAYAWCKHPEEAAKDPLWYKYGHGFECDHKNCDHSNFSPENLEWVKTPENSRRRYQVEEPLKKAGIAKVYWVRIPLLERLYQFKQAQLDHFFRLLPTVMAETPGELNIENINNAASEAIIRTLHDISRNDSSAT